MRCLLSQPIFAKQGQVQIFVFLHTDHPPSHCYTKRSELDSHKICPPFLIQTLKPVQVLSGRVLMVANAKQSYDLTIECKIEVNQS